MPSTDPALRALVSEKAALERWHPGNERIAIIDAELAAARWWQDLLALPASAQRYVASVLLGLEPLTDEGVTRVVNECYPPPAVPCRICGDLANHAGVAHNDAVAGDGLLRTDIEPSVEAIKRTREWQAMVAFGLPDEERAHTSCATAFAYAALKVRQRPDGIGA